MDNNIVSFAPYVRTAPPPGLSLGCSGIELSPVFLGIDNSFTYFYITIDAAVKTVLVFTIERGHRQVPIITAAAGAEPYIFYRNGYVLHMAGAVPPANHGGRATA